MTCSLDTAIEAMVWIEIGLNVISLCALIVLFIVFIMAAHEAPDKFGDAAVGIGITIFVATLVIILCYIGLSLYLIRSVKHRDHRGCQKWLIISVVLTILGIVGVILNGGFVLCTLGSLIWRAILCVLVHKFMNELSQNNVAPAPYYKQDGKSSMKH